MAALEFLVLSVPVRIGVEQLPLPPESCSLSLLARLFFLSSVYTTLLFCVCAQGVVGRKFVVYKSLHFNFIAYTWLSVLQVSGLSLMLFDEVV